MATWLLIANNTGHMTITNQWESRHMTKTTNRCVRLEAALRRMISVWHQSTTIAIREQMDPYAFESLSLYFDVIHWSFCAVPLQVEHTYWEHDTWTNGPIAWIHEGKGSMTQTGTMTKVQNKRHENMNIKQIPKTHVTVRCVFLFCLFFCKKNVRSTSNMLTKTAYIWYSNTVKTLLLWHICDYSSTYGNMNLYKSCNIH